MFNLKVCMPAAAQLDGMLGPLLLQGKYCDGNGATLLK